MGEDAPPEPEQASPDSHDSSSSRRQGRHQREAGDVRRFVTSLRAHERGDAEVALRDFSEDVRGELLTADSYVPVFLLTIAIVIIIPLAENQFITQVPLILLTTGTLLLALRRSHLQPRTLKRATIAGFVTGILALTTKVILLSTDQNGTVLKATTGLFFIGLVGLAIPAMLRRVLLARRVTLNMLCGALTAYLLLGIFFASLFGFIAVIHPQSQFFAQKGGATSSDFEYFSFITITTVGYGDLSPGNDAARAGAVAEAIIGQVFLVTIVARVVSHLGTERPVNENLREVRRSRPTDGDAGTDTSVGEPSG